MCLPLLPLPLPLPVQLRTREGGRQHGRGLPQSWVICIHPLPFVQRRAFLSGHLPSFGPHVLTMEHVQPSRWIMWAGLELFAAEQSGQVQAVAFDRAVQMQMTG